MGSKSHGGGGGGGGGGGRGRGDGGGGGGNAVKLEVTPGRCDLIVNDFRRVFGPRLTFIQ